MDPSENHRSACDDFSARIDRMREFGNMWAAYFQAFEEFYNEAEEALLDMNLTPAAERIIRKRLLMFKHSRNQMALTCSARIEAISKTIGRSIKDIIDRSNVNHE